MFLYSFEKLDVWKNARTLVTKVYEITATFPATEKYGLSSQIQRAAVSVVSNIAEGMSRTSLKEQAHFIEIAYGSLTEVYCQLIIAVDLHYLKETELETIKPNINLISNQLNALKNSIKKRMP